MVVCGARGQVTVMKVTKEYPVIWAQCRYFLQWRESHSLHSWYFAASMLLCRLGGEGASSVVGKGG